MTSSYNDLAVRYFDGDAPNEEEDNPVKHQDVPIQPDVHNEYPTTTTDHFPPNSMMPTPSTKDIQFTDEGQLSNIRGRGDCGHYVTQQERLRHNMGSSSGQEWEHHSCSL
ncbi:unnamed protein product [Citrullus colocynthis]|uniref:Uncharacterized protein n=1 Tax=Citrullus colocynthis TaxID=252529 RepID=A0ABP0Y9G4_9ROSI